MGNAILTGLQGAIEDGGSALNHIQLFGYDKMFNSPICGETRLSGESEVAQKCKYVLLAVKPSIVGEVLNKIAPTLTPESVLISICAGVSTKFIRSKTSESQKIACVMPNTPMIYQEGASTVSFCENVSDSERAFVRSILEVCGICEEISPDKANESICLNGSSPAFIFEFAKYFVDYAVKQGIEYAPALKLFAKTLTGSAKMLSENIMSIDDLISQVCSPNGTTESGLKAMRENGFEKAVKAGCKACTKRAYEIQEELEAELGEK